MRAAGGAPTDRFRPTPRQVRSTPDDRDHRRGMEAPRARRVRRAVRAPRSASQPRTVTVDPGSQPPETACQGILSGNRTSDHVPTGTTSASIGGGSGSAAPSSAALRARPEAPSPSRARTRTDDATPPRARHAPTQRDAGPEAVVQARIDGRSVEPGGSGVRRPLQLHAVQLPTAAPHGPVDFQGVPPCLLQGESRLVQRGLVRVRVRALVDIVMIGEARGGQPYRQGPDLRGRRKRERQHPLHPRCRPSRRRSA